MTSEELVQSAKKDLENATKKLREATNSSNLEKQSWNTSYIIKLQKAFVEVLELPFKF